MLWGLDTIVDLRWILLLRVTVCNYVANVGIVEVEHGEVTVQILGFVEGKVWCCVLVYVWMGVRDC